MFKVKFADIGEGLTEGTVTEVFVKVGDTVKVGDNLFNVETDKVNSDIAAEVAGKISKINIKADQEINVGDIVMEIDDGSAGETSAEPAKAAEPEEENASVVGATPVSNEVISRAPEAAAAAPAKAQVANYVNSNVLASPVARKLAAKKGVDLSTVKGSGPHGRILEADIANFSGASASAGGAGVSMSAMGGAPKASKVDYSNPAISVPDTSAPLSFTDVPMNGIRKATVKAMTNSHQNVAAFTGMRNIDITNLVETRRQMKGYADSQRVKLTYLAFIVKATAMALKEMPNINARIDEANKVIKQVNNINIGVAVDTPEGLMVPVIQGADKLTILQIAVKINELATKAKNKSLKMTEMKDATFTVSNFGSVGLDYATPIVNQPESAILGVGTMTKTPKYINGELAARDVMPFSMTADHRIIDGGDAGRFLLKVENYLQNPALLML